MTKRGRALGGQERTAISTMDPQSPGVRQKEWEKELMESAEAENELVATCVDEELGDFIERQWLNEVVQPSTQKRDRE